MHWRQSYAVAPIGPGLPAVDKDEVENLDELHVEEMLYGKLEIPKQAQMELDIA